MIVTQLFAAACTGGDFLGFPKWYKYLDGRIVNNACAPQITALSDVWLILAAVIEIMLRIAALLAVGFVIYGGFTYMTSQGEPEKTAQARSTIVSALVGLALAVLAAGIITFVAGRIN